MSDILERITLMSGEKLHGVSVSLVDDCGIFLTVYLTDLLLCVDAAINGRVFFCQRGVCTLNTYMYYLLILTHTYT